MRLLGEVVGIFLWLILAVLTAPSLLAYVFWILFVLNIIYMFYDQASRI